MAKNILQFSVDSQLMGELGEKLVTKNYIALSELIKNSYDADATGITVRLQNTSEGGVDNNNAEIQIIDDGTGLAFEEVKSNWMRIATTNKVDEPISRIFGRQRTGNKGIGRFACQKISRILELETTARINARKYETTTVHFDWSKFIPGTDITEIPCEYHVKHATKGKTGFKLRLINLRDRWTQRDYDMLRRQVLFISANKGVKRKDFEEDPGFDIHLDAQEFHQGEGLLYDQFVNSGWGTLKGKVLASGEVKLKLSAKYIGTKEYSLPKQYPKIAKTSFEISWIPQITEFFRDRTTLPKYIAKSMREWAGIRLYNEGFRIYPYGDIDWLGIDQDVARRKASIDNPALKAIAKKLNLEPSRVLLDYPRHHSLVGRVFIHGGKNSNYSIKMDREGLLDNDAYRHLVEVLRLSIDWMVLYFSVAKRKIAKNKLKETEKSFVRSTKSSERDTNNLVRTAVQLLSETATQIEKGSTAKPNVNVIKQARAVIESKFEEAGAELTVLRAMASTGPLLFVFAHEVKGTISTLDTNALYLEDLAATLRGDRKNYVEDLANSFRTTSKRFTQISELFGVFSSAQKLERNHIPLKKVLTKIKTSFSFIISEYNIEFDISGVSDRLKTPYIMEAELYSILVNLISNAIKALIAGNGSKLCVNASKDTHLTLHVCDDGVGISERYWEEVFEPLSIDPEDTIYSKLSLQIGDNDLASLGRGSGLGLSIVKGIVEDYSGTVSFRKPDKGWSTCIEVKWK